MFWNFRRAASFVSQSVTVLKYLLNTPVLTFCSAWEFFSYPPPAAPHPKYHRETFHSSFFSSWCLRQNGGICESQVRKVCPISTSSTSDNGNQFLWSGKVCEDAVSYFLSSFQFLTYVLGYEIWVVSILNLSLFRNWFTCYYTEKCIHWDYYLNCVAVWGWYAAHKDKSVKSGPTPVSVSKYVISYILCWWNCCNC